MAIFLLHIFYICNEACKDNYPKNYWKRCSLNCARLKARGTCTKKWNNVLTGNCKRTIPAWHRNRYVSQYCQKTCGRCSKIIPFLVIIHKLYVILINAFYTIFLNIQLFLKGYGKWNRLSTFNTCSATCGGGTKTRYKTCIWSGGGKACRCPEGMTCNPPNCRQSPCRAYHSVRCNTNSCRGRSLFINHLLYDISLFTIYIFKR